MKTTISYKELRIEITIDDDRCDNSQKCQGVKPPNKPVDVTYPMSLKDKRKMDEQVEATKQILGEG